MKTLEREEFDCWQKWQDYGEKPKYIDLSYSEVMQSVNEFIEKLGPESVVSVNEVSGKKNRRSIVVFYWVP